MMYEAIDDLMKKKRWDDAQFVIETRLQIHPTTGMLHAYLGMCHYWKQDYAKAEVCFLRAYTLDGKLGEAAVKRAQCLERLKRYRDAMEVVKEWRPLRPNDHILEGLEEFLKMQHSAQEHDNWEKTRAANLRIESGSSREEA